VNLRVKNIIFILNSSPPGLIPCRVIEQIVSRKIDGESITHTISTHSGKTYVLEELGSPWFKSLDDARAYLISQAEGMIDKTISKAMSIVESKFRDINDRVENLEFNEISTEEVSLGPESESMTVDLGDGTHARIQLPEALK